jgi:branched-chain amino acid transport system substrate-binding protein
MHRRLPALACCAVVVAAMTGCTPGAHRAALRIGAVFPLTGSASSLGAEEYAGLRFAADLVNSSGGVNGQRIAFDVRDVTHADQAGAAIASLHQDGVPVVVGGYSSDLSLPASAAAAQAGLVYWEAGGVADRITGRGLPLVFRVGATGGQLGGNAARFVVHQIAPRLHRRAASLRVTEVVADDAYAGSVARAVSAVMRRAGARVTRIGYDAAAPLWAPVIADVRASRPDILLLASHIPDGIAFRRAFLAAHLHVDAFVGSTMAQCLPNFGDALGPDAVGVFASDRPDESLDPGRLPAAGRALYGRLAAAWHERYGRAPSEEALSGFSAGWVLLHDVLPVAAGTGRLTPAAISAAARSVNLPTGSLPNGAGVRFSSAVAELGQNLRASAVIWQWQAPRHSVVVWPPAYATGTVKMVPLPA